MSFRGKSAPLGERFHALVSPEPNTGCWLWAGSTNLAGYGQLWANGKIRPAHRIAWELLRTPIPVGLWVLHRCDNPPCVNPDHLFLGTRSDNMLDCATKNRIARVGRPRIESHCRHGHAFDEANTIHENGYRRCRECKNAGLRRRTRLAAFLRGEKGDG